MARALSNGVAAIAIAFFACYVLHLAALFTSMILMAYRHPAFGAVVLILALMIPLIPVLAGYVAARLSSQRPELNGLLVSLLGAALYVLTLVGPGSCSLGDPVAAAVFVIGYVCTAGWGGAWLGRVVGARLARRRKIG